MKQVGVYILKGSRYYVGSTNDLQRRLIDHTNTKRIGDWKLVQFIPCETLNDAKKLETKIKRSKNITRWIEQPRTI